MKKLFFEAVTFSVSLFLTPTEYGRLLCTCKEATKHDYKNVWLRYTHVRPYQKMSKPLAFLSDILLTHKPSVLLHNTTRKKNMRMLLNCLRRLVNHATLSKVYQDYLTNKTRSENFDQMVRMERILVSGKRRRKLVVRRLRR